MDRISLIGRMLRYTNPNHSLESGSGDLGFHLQQLGRFTPVMAQYYSARTVLGIRHLHQKGIVYRDLKPENVMLDEYGRSKISDMGLACKVTPYLTGACGTRGCKIVKACYKCNSIILYLTGTAVNLCFVLTVQTTLAD